jgi:hypothetical protein
LFWELLRPLFFGSSGNSGERGSDLEEEIVIVPKPECHPFDDLDFVVDAFQEAGMQRPATVRQDTVESLLEVACEPLQGLDTAVDVRRR